MKKVILLLVVLSGFGGAKAQRLMENLNRGLVAIKTTDGVYSSWRIPGEEWFDAEYNIYRDGENTPLNPTPLKTSNFIDPQGSLSSTYRVTVLIDGKESVPCESVGVWEKQYFDIPMCDIYSPRTGKKMNQAYSINDVSVADLDGDGVYEFIVKRMNGDFSIANDTAFCRFEAYEADGRHLWSIDMGPNLINAGHVETNCMAFDFDLDGKAEVVLRGTDGTQFPDGTILGSKNANYRDGNTYQCKGDEWLVVCEGSTGKILAKEIFDSKEGGANKGNNLARRSAAFWWEGNSKAYGHRANKFHFGAPYLDGRHPSIYIGRGCYTNMHACAWDYENGKLTRRWTFATDDPKDPWYGQGFHNFSIVDVDQDGRDEICHGNMVLDEFGQRLSSTGLGHGDALHFGDLDPFRPGVESFRCLESSSGAVFVDAASNEKLLHWVRGTDNGRCLAGNFSDKWPGAQLYTTDGHLWSATLSRNPNHNISSSGDGITMNGRIYWDGDILEEAFDYASRNSDNAGVEMSIRKHGIGEIWRSTGCFTNNSTKGNPCIQADLFGDWREELVMRTQDNTKLRIFTTTSHTNFRNYTLMHDIQYRQGVYWQMTGYNQPPHVSYYLGELEGITLPPPPLCMNGKTEVSEHLSSAQDGQFVYIGESNAPKTVNYECYLGTHDFENSNVVTQVSGTIKLKGIQLFAFSNHIINGGIWDGAMHLEKLGKQSLTLSNGTYQYTGETNIWQGALVVESDIPNSHIIVRRFAELKSGAKFNSGITLEHGSILHPGQENQIGTISTSKMEINGEAVWSIDIPKDGSANDVIYVDSLILKGFNYTDSYSKRSVNYNLKIKLCILDGESIPSGDYVIAHIAKGHKGDISTITVEGIDGLGGKIILDGNRLIVRIKESRNASKVVWKGSNSSVWDFNETENFAFIEGSDQEKQVFVTGDSIIFDEFAHSFDVKLNEVVYPSNVLFTGDKNYSLSGDGHIAGSCDLIKKGKGTLYINTFNTFSGGSKLLEGTTCIKSIADAQNGGPLGACTEEEGFLYIGDSATLKAEADIINPTPLQVGAGAIVYVASGHSFTQNSMINGETVTVTTRHEGSSEDGYTTITETKVSLDGYLVKQGAGAMNLKAYNKLRRLDIYDGQVAIPYEYADQSAIGDTLVMYGGALNFTNNANAYQKSKNVWYVPAGAKASVRSATRIEHHNKLIGSGELTFKQYNQSNTPRAYVYSDWSSFSGKLIASSYENAERKFFIHNANGIPQGEFCIESGTTVYLGGNGKELSGTYTVGSLTGSGEIANGDWHVGSRHEDFTFEGLFLGGSLTKVGYGKMTLQKEQSIDIALHEGTLFCKTKPTTGLISVKTATATLQIVAGKIGNVSTTYGGSIVLGGTGNDRTVQATVDGEIKLRSGCPITFHRNSYGLDRLVVSSSGKVVFSRGAIIHIEDYEGASSLKSGDELKLFTLTGGTITDNGIIIEYNTLADGLYWDTSRLSTEGVLVVAGVETSLHHIESENEENQKPLIYDFSGKRVDTPEKGKMYIINGKKGIL